MNTYNFLAGNLLNSINDYVSILDKESNFIQVNNKQMSIMGYQSPLNIIGKTYHQFKGVPTNVVENFFAEDKVVLKKNNPLRYLSYRKYSNGTWHLLLGDKSSISDDTGQVIGIFSQAKDITDHWLIDISRFMFDANKKYAPKFDKLGFDCVLIREDDTYGLSKKEMEVLFYFLRGKCAREIASIIYRSEKTINFHLDKIKFKFNVTSKSVLIEKAVSEGYMNIIPENLIQVS